MKYRLYAGLVRHSVWYNYAERVGLDDFKGGSLAVLDGQDKSGAAKLINLAKGTVKKLYSEDGQEYELLDSDYETFTDADGFKIAMEAMRLITGEDYPVFDEYFFCQRCSTLKNEKYTHVRESWFDLIEQGFIDEIYLDDPDSSWVTELPHGVEIEGLAQGTYKKIKRDLLTLGDMAIIQNTPECMETESNLIRAYWDMQIKEIQGLSPKEFNIYVKRSLKDSFSKRFIVNQKDINTMSNSYKKIGLDTRYRSVRCQYCHYEIGGEVDFTNFLGFLFPKKSDQNDITVM